MPQMRQSQWLAKDVQYRKNSSSPAMTKNESGLLLANCCRAKLPVGQISARRANQCPAPYAKIFRFPRRANHLYKLARLVPQGAARDRHERGTGCGGRGTVVDERRLLPHREIVWSSPP